MPVPVRIPFLTDIEPVANIVPATSRLRVRDDNNLSRSNTYIILGVVATILLLFVGIVLLRTLRRRHASPKYIPTAFLKRLWTKWDIPQRRTGYHATGHDDDGSARRANRTTEASENAGGYRTELRSTNSRNNGSDTVARNTSVRSVLTLPAYQPKAADTEQVLGREGERDGIDVVVELPTAEEDEALRDEEMEALYQIRAARRRQVAHRDELRQQRRDARQRHDASAVEAVRQQAAAANQANTEEVNGLRREHERIKQTRERAVSSVSYAELGVARADGTRLRANSTESERAGLLSDAASIALSTRSPSGTGQASLFSRRDRRASSTMSIDTARSNERPGSPGLHTRDSTYSLHSAGPRSRAGSGATTPYLSGSYALGGSSPRLLLDGADGVDLGASSMPPPEYDEVSLDEPTPVHSRNSRSGHNSPYPEPPPDYPGPSRTRHDSSSTYAVETAVGNTDEDDARSTGSRLSLARLPSLRTERLPQIVIEPSTAQPHDAVERH